MLKFRDLEKIAKGFSNHRRIQVLELLVKQPELSVFEIANELNVNYKTISEHVRRLAIAGLVMKRNAGKDVRHALTNRGKLILTFLRTLE